MLLFPGKNPGFTIEYSQAIPLNQNSRGSLFQILTPPPLCNSEILNCLEFCVKIQVTDALCAQKETGMRLGALHRNGSISTNCPNHMRDFI